MSQWLPGDPLNNPDPRTGMEAGPVEVPGDAKLATALLMIGDEIAGTRQFADPAPTVYATTVTRLGQVDGEEPKQYTFYLQSGNVDTGWIYAADLGEANATAVA